GFSNGIDDVLRYIPSTCLKLIEKIVNSSLMQESYTLAKTCPRYQIHRDTCHRCFFRGRSLPDKSRATTHRTISSLMRPIYLQGSQKRYTNERVKRGASKSTHVTIITANLHRRTKTGHPPRLRSIATQLKYSCNKKPPPLLVCYKQTANATPRGHASRGGKKNNNVSIKWRGAVAQTPLLLLDIVVLRSSDSLKQEIFTYL
ncbi:unnamed protein product, partial [Ectocarpus sp. 12 AP-2014]